jgi:hypothetical protein
MILKKETCSLISSRWGCRMFGGRPGPICLKGMKKKRSPKGTAPAISVRQPNRLNPTPPPAYAAASPMAAGGHLRPASYLGDVSALSFLPSSPRPLLLAGTLPASSLFPSSPAPRRARVCLARAPLCGGPSCACAWRQ